MNQTQKATKIGMKQPNYSKWLSRILNDPEVCLKGEARRVMQSENLKVKFVKRR